MKLDIAIVALAAFIPAPLAQAKPEAADSTFMDTVTTSIHAINDLTILANKTDFVSASGTPEDMKCILLVAANVAAIGAVVAAKGNELCNAASLACPLAHSHCTAAGCSGCITCPSC